MLEAAVVAGLTSAGADAVRVGVLPTPAVAFLVDALSADFGVMISASHNPMPDNGIKLFAAGGHKLPDALEMAVEAGLDEPAPRPTGSDIGRVRDLPDAGRRYVDHLVAATPGALAGLRVVVDCAHGAASVTAPEAYRRVGPARRLRAALTARRAATRSAPMRCRPATSTPWASAPARWRCSPRCRRPSARRRSCASPTPMRLTRATGRDRPGGRRPRRPVRLRAEPRAGGAELLGRRGAAAVPGRAGGRRFVDGGDRQPHAAGAPAGARRAAAHRGPRRRGEACEAFRADRPASIRKVTWLIRRSSAGRTRSSASRAAARHDGADGRGRRPGARRMPASARRTSTASSSASSTTASNARTSKARWSPWARPASSTCRPSAWRTPAPPARPRSTRRWTSSTPAAAGSRWSSAPRR